MRNKKIIVLWRKYKKIMMPQGSIFLKCDELRSIEKRQQR